MTEATITPSIFSNGTLKDAFELQTEIQQLNENLAAIKRMIDSREKQIACITAEHLRAGTMQEGRLYLKQKLGRRALDVSLFEQEYPEEFKQVAKVKYSATIPDALKVLPENTVETLCTRGSPTWIIDMAMREE